MMASETRKRTTGDQSNGHSPATDEVVERIPAPSALGEAALEQPSGAITSFRARLSPVADLTEPPPVLPGTRWNQEKGSSVARRIGTPANTPEGLPNFAACALRRGIDFKRALTHHERLTLAIAVTGPTHHVTFSTKSGDYESVTTGFRRLVRRVERRKHAKGPLLYVGTVAHGLGDGGCHLHLLGWDFTPFFIYRAHSEAVGLGTSWPVEIPRDLTNRVWVASYVLGQHESVFGTEKHLENAEHPKSKRRLLMPQDATLKEHNPKLFVALDLAKDQSVSDKSLCRELLIFIKEDVTKTLGHRTDGLQGRPSTKKPLASASREAVDHE